MKKILIKDNQNRTTDELGFVASDFIDSFSGEAAPVKTLPTGFLDPSILPPVSGVAEAAKEVVATVTYGETIGALKLIYIGNDGRAYLATSAGTYEQASAIGITRSGGNANDVRQILLFGRVDDPSFTFPLVEDLFLGTLGNLVDIAPVSGHYKPIGQSLQTGSIFLNIGKTIVL